MSPDVIRMGVGQGLARSAEDHREGEQQGHRRPAEMCVPHPHVTNAHIAGRMRDLTVRSMAGGFQGRCVRGSWKVWQGPPHLGQRGMMSDERCCFHVCDLHIVMGSLITAASDEMWRRTVHCEV